jgi:hypothetical protein
VSALDRRADVWAFGCVLFEMLAGRQPFKGDSINDLLAAVVSEEPDWTALPPTTPPGVQRLIRRCLKKDPRQRLHDIADAKLDLEEALSEPAVIATVARTATPAWRRALPWGLVTVLSIGTAVLAWRARQAPVGQSAAPVRFSVTAPAPFEINGVDGHRLRCRPTGREWRWCSSVGERLSSTPVLSAGSR